MKYFYSRLFGNNEQLTVKSSLKHNTFRYEEGSAESILSPSDGSTIHVLLYKFPTALINPRKFKLIWLYFSVHCSKITGTKFCIERLRGSDGLFLIIAQLRGALIWSNGGIILTAKLEIPRQKSAATHHNH